MTIFKNPRVQPCIWFVYAGIVTTALCGILYVSIQQSFRQNLNDPQLQMAEDAARALDAGAVPAAVVPRAPLIDIAQSLAPWIAVYDSNGAPLDASGQLDNAPPQPPKSLFDVSTWRAIQIYGTSAGKETRVTWQSGSGVRQALIIVATSDGKFVVAGRNMREIEGRIENVGAMILAAWVVTVGSLFVLSAFLWWVRKE